METISSPELWTTLSLYINNITSVTEEYYYHSRCIHLLPNQITIPLSTTVTYGCWNTVLPHSEFQHTLDESFPLISSRFLFLCIMARTPTPRLKSSPLPINPPPNPKVHRFSANKALGRQRNCKYESPIPLQLGDINSNPLSRHERVCHFCYVYVPIPKRQCTILAGFKKKNINLMCKGKL